jgi:DNA repair protein RadA/Sms
MSKLKTSYECKQCASVFPKWMGQCAECKSWNSLIEKTASAESNTKIKKEISGYAGKAQITSMNELVLTKEKRTKPNNAELARVLGGGIVTGSGILLGGDPGIGKSTLLLQISTKLSLQHRVLYTTGEESLQQVTLRARRLELPEKELFLLTETCVETLIEHAQKHKPEIMVIDSIQTLYTHEVTSAPGSVSQIRETTAKLVRYAKQTNTSIFIIGHVTKEGTLAGPRVLEHMVDCVLYFEGDVSSRYRIIRAIKNRFGAVNEIGIFAMTEKGLKNISNPSAIFLSNYSQPVSGSIIFVTREGTRPLMVEIQALVDESNGHSKRLTQGLDQNRLSMLLAILHRHCGVAMFDQDIYVNIVGGVKVTETAADLAVLLATYSSFRDKPIDATLIAFGEVGLSGELRPIPNGEERVLEAYKQGFKKAIIPKANQPRNPPKDMEIYAVTRLQDAIELI